MEMTSLILLQIAVILLLCRALSWLLRRMDQPEVVCQMLAGVMIGPSLLGLWPTWRQAVFPSSSVGVIAAVGQLGLVVFMFCAGTELDLGVLRRRARAALAISVASVAIPLAAGAAVASQLVGDVRLFPAGVNPQVQVAFLGVAVAITAFPVMARIIAEAGLTSTVVGTSSLAAGSFTDAIAWCLLALLLAALSGTRRGLAVTLAAALALFGLVLVARSRPVARLLTRAMVASTSLAWVTAGILVPLLLVSWLSDVAGLHPAFGAFVVGLAMPRSELVV
jgi:Kef-type K+ transport system membrane component KefB